MTPVATKIHLEPLTDTKHKHETIEPLVIRACNETDINEMFFPADRDDWSKDKLNSMRDDMFCLDDPNAIALEGQFHNDDCTILKISWEICIGK